MRTYDLTGVIEVGGVRGTNVPQSTTRTLKVYVGETVRVNLRILKSDGTPWEIATSDVITLMVKDRPGEEGDKKLLATATRDLLAGEGHCYFTMTALQTKRMGEEGKLRLFYDIYLKDINDERYVLIPTSALLLVQSVQVA